MTSETTPFPRRQTMLALFAAVAFFGAASIAQAQSTTTAPTRTTPSATSTPGTPSASDTTRSGSTSMNAQGSTAAAGSPTQVNPNTRDSNRQASQGMVPSAYQDSSAQARVNAPDSNLRNDRTTMARAPRADRN
jgi:hypothetical protein